MQTQKKLNKMGLRPKTKWGWA